MPQRAIQEEASFRECLVKLFKTTKAADEAIEGAIEFLCTQAEEGRVFPNTKIYYTMAADFPNDRILVLSYIFDSQYVRLLSVKTIPT